MKLSERVGQVKAHRGVADREALGDELVGAAAGHQPDLATIQANPAVRAVYAGGRK